MTKAMKPYGTPDFSAPPLFDSACIPEPIAMTSSTRAAPPLPGNWIVDKAASPAERFPVPSFAAVLLVAFALRFGAALLLPNIDYPDEIFQTLEPAFRMATGQGLVTWEWREGLRSPLFPALLAGPIALASALGLGPEVFLPVIAGLLSLLSTAVVAAAFMIGWKLHGRSGALICGWLCAFWPDLVYYGPKTLTEAQAGNLMVLAAWTGWYARSRRHGPPFGLPLVTGLLLGLAFCFRFHLAPALAIVACGTAGFDWRRRWPMLALGALVPLAAMGTLDAVFWGAPFASLWRNVDVNLVQGVSKQYGVEGAGWYVQALVLRWHIVTLAMAVTFVLGLRSAPGLAALAVVVLLSHSLVAHKELRFIYPAIPPLVIVCGVGTARLFDGVPERLRRLGLLAPVVVWAALSVSVAAAPFMQIAFHKGAADMQAWRALREDPNVCGIGLRNPDVPWWNTGGAVGLGRELPLYAFATSEGEARAAPSFNALLKGRNSGGPPLGFRLTRCWSDLREDVCLYRAEPDRKCVAAPSLDINHLP